MNAIIDNILTALQYYFILCGALINLIVFFIYLAHKTEKRTPPDKMTKEEFEAWHDKINHFKRKNQNERIF
jgi:hypothetical protein